MQKVFFVGNLTRDPELNYTQDGIAKCNFTVAVNRRSSKGEQEADFFRVTAWRGSGENCAKFLSKGKKVSVVGRVSVSAYLDKEGKPRASLEVQADDVEFLSPKNEEGAYIQQEREAIQQENSGMTPVETDELPF